MQIATIAPKPPVRSLLGPNTPGTGPHNPIGVTSYGTMRVGHALNGVTYTEHQLLAPLQSPLVTHTGSLQDAIAGAKAQLHRTELAAGAEGRLAVALLGVGNSWRAQLIYSDPTVVRAIDSGPGSVGIASVDFPSRARSLAALVTSQGSIVLGQLDR